MTALAIAVSAIDTTWLVDTDDIIAGLNYPVRLVCEDEAIEVTGAEYVTFNATERTRWTVRRGVDGTTPAVHAGLTAITASTFGSDGGTSDHTALTNLDTADQHPIAAVEGLEAALAAAEVVVTATRIINAATTEDDATVLAAEILTADVGSLVSGTAIPAGATIVSVVNGVSFELSEVATATNAVDDVVRVTEPDPGAIGPNRLWRRGEADDAGLSIRDTTDAYWIALGPAYYDANGGKFASVAMTGDNLALTRFNAAGSAASEVLVGSELQLRQNDALGEAVATVGYSADGVIDVLATDFTYNGKTVAGKTAAVADLSMSVEDPPSQAQVQAIADKIDELLGKMRTATALVP